MSSPGTLLLQARGLGFRHAARTEPLFEGLDLALHVGSRIAIVGSNGAGKTSLLRVLLAELPPTDGVVTRASGSVGWLRQADTPGSDGVDGVAPHLADPEPGPDGAARCPAPHEPAVGLETTRAAAWWNVLHARPELARLHVRIRAWEHGDVPDPLAYADALARYEELGGYRLERRARAEADALGLDPEILDRPTATLSGGERRLVGLLATLVDPPEILVLDEPTNYLDETAVAWLVAKLRGHAGGSLIASHDRWFLDQVATEVLELERGSIRRGRGTYSAYAAAREADRRWRAREKARHEREIVELRHAAHGYGVWAGRKEKEKSGAFDKGFIGARAARLQKRAVALRDRALAQAEELERVKPWVDKRRELAFEAVRVPEGKALIARGLRVGPVSLPDLDLGWGERVAVTGRNGSGKTTLLRVLARDVTPSSGHATWAAGARVGWLPQSFGWLDRTRDVSSMFALHEEERARTLLGSLGVGAAEYASEVGALSEGQVRKVVLVRRLLDAPNVLLLDEPTTHLDVPSIELLERALAGYAGTVVLVTHDRYLRDRTTMRTVSVEPSDAPA